MPPLRRGEALAIGNPTTYRDNTLTWDGRQLASYNGISYTYDADGMRASKTVGTAKTEYFYSGDKLVYQVVSDTATGDVTYEMYFLYDSYGNLTTIRYVTATKDHYYYVSTNIQGDVLGIYTASGVLLASYDYDAWGNCTLTTHNTNYNIGDLNPIRYRGYYYDTETELYYCASRYYDAEIGRWINADGLLSQDSVLGNNVFAYCLNNPVANSDPSGFMAYRDAGCLAIPFGGCFGVGYGGGGGGSLGVAIAYVGTASVLLVAASTLSFSTDALRQEKFAIKEKEREKAKAETKAKGVPIANYWAAEVIYGVVTPIVPLTYSQARLWVEMERNLLCTNKSAAIAIVKFYPSAIWDPPHGNIQEGYLPHYHLSSAHNNHIWYYGG